MKTQNAKLSIVMPVRNEGRNIEIMLKSLKREVALLYEVLIVYDSKDDDSIPMVKKLKPAFPSIGLFHNTKGRGVANAIRFGMQAANGEILLILSADDLGPVYAIEDMMELMKQGCDFVSATRYAYGGRRDKDSIIQRILSRTANKLFNLLTGSVFSDLTTGFKMVRKSALWKLSLESDSISWAIAFEMAIKAQAAGLRLGEVPIRSTDRKHGTSTFKLGPWVKEYLGWFFWGIKRLRRKKIENPLVRIPKNIYTR